MFVFMHVISHIRSCIASYTKFTNKYANTCMNISICPILNKKRRAKQAAVVILLQFCFVTLELEQLVGLDFNL